MGRVRTPCIAVCQLDWTTGWCLGCGRTGAEIAGWLRYSEEQRDTVMGALPERMRALGLPEGGDYEEGERRAMEQRLGTPPAGG